MTQFILDELRHLILKKVGIRVVCPSDCQVIALAISKKVNKSISETTIKRLFGFATIHHQFSKFTINTLLEYVENDDTHVVTDAAINGSPYTGDKDWDYLIAKARTLSESTIKRVITQSEIPYHLTINRKFAEHDFNYFYSSNYIFTAFIAQAGYGKSILLSHLVQNLFLKPGAKYAQDVVLFLHAERVFNVETESQNLETDLQKLLGLSTEKDIITYFNEQYAKNGKKLVLIFDGFHEILRRNGLKPKIFDSIVKMLCDLEGSPAIKLVLSMRSYAWKRFYQNIRHSHYLKSKWFAGSYFRSIEQSNVPTFTEAEVDILFSKISSFPSKRLNSELKYQLKYPFHISYYYELKSLYPENEYRTNLVFYEMTLQHLSKKIYSSKHSVEKLILCKQLIQLSDYGLKGNRIDKSLLMDEFTVFRDAYMELLLDGLLIEEQHHEHGFPIELVRFIHPHIFEYFLFKETLERHQDQMSPAFFEAIVSGYSNNKLALPLLKWATFFTIKNGDFDPIISILNLKLGRWETNQLMLFMAEQFNYQLQNEPESLNGLKKHNIHQELLRKFAEIDFIDPSYCNLLKIFSEISQDEEVKAIYYSMVFIFDSFSLQASKLQQHIEEFDPATHPLKNWPVHPATFGALLLQLLNGENISEDPAWVQFDLENNGQALLEQMSGAPQYACSIFLLLLNWLNGNLPQVIDLINSIKNFKQSGSISDYYSIYMLHVLALAYANSGNTKKADQLERILNHIHEHPLRPDTSPCAKDLQQLVLAQQYLNKGNYELALLHGHESVERYKKNHCLALQMIAYQVLIRTYLETKDIDKANEYRYTVLCLLDEKKINSNLFSFQAIVSNSIINP
ncbi:NACHT domain-containing protein [Pedobacter sp. KR3-3]|uniref:NACHT domain-containing protein n=1 Tax=Pedobacter albus TaxID=3113905 RepID=A0ABU7I3B2_9SPHI|nr:NACHT domain-containing protein [Pedobacter sp. KR3-3]MEE1943796.1 NACHT domain-containing protein [Pedobacter sp. KR3-3]